MTPNRRKKPRTLNVSSTERENTLFVKIQAPNLFDTSTPQSPSKPLLSKPMGKGKSGRIVKANGYQWMAQQYLL
jgi:hypothetical protein